ncbi:MAG: YdcF family protein [Patescibacteria group bacterium]
MHIVLLGGGITPDGQLPDKKFIQERLCKVQELHAQLRAPIIISGGYSYLLEEAPPRTEAAAMREALVAMGVPEKAITLEEQSKDTVSNAYFVKKILGQSEDALVIVTSDFHAERAEYIFKQVFGDNCDIRVEAAPSFLPSEQFEKITAHQKELIGKTQELFKGMEPGDETFLDGKFFSDPYYTEERPAWVRKFVANGH